MLVPFPDKYESAARFPDYSNSHCVFTIDNLLMFWHKTKIVIQYDKEIPQSQTTDKSVAS